MTDSVVRFSEVSWPKSLARTPTAFSGSMLIDFSSSDAPPSCSDDVP